MKPDLIKRTRLTRHQKLLLCSMTIASPKMSYRELAQWAKMTFKLHSTPNKSMVSRTLKARSRLLEDAADHADRKKAPTHGQLLLDHNVVDFIMLAELQGIALSGDLIVYHAKKLGRKLGIQRAQQPRFGRSWLRCLQERYGFRWRRAFSEASSVDLDGIQEELDALKAVIRQYSPSNVFNMDESALFYNAAPRGSICKNTAPALKQNKARVAMACCANADGTEKLPLLFLGTAAKPRWYAKKPADMQYAGTEKGWMTTWMYQQWLVDLDAKMALQDRRVLLLVDTASSHDETGLQLTPVHVLKLPPNTTAKIQPMDQGIIYCIKREVLSKKMKHALERIGEFDGNPYKVCMLTALEWCEAAWNKVLATTIRNC